ncbi:MAG: hypothetical protein CVU89_12305 [Firmicutes bacterium HGW-Firmicutes-14]|jgi:hypothetical protein|nr:MAG: hypothetical protein CVU89_12305 [Firmicutes bacterium HGW-Firmicutes-14]
MYLPFLRGRQYELLALCELVEAACLGKHIIPIIEPVKLSSTFIKTLKSFVHNRKKIAVIHNPQVGSFSKDLEDEKKNGFKQKYEELLKNKLIIKAHILNKHSKSELKQTEAQGFHKKDLLIITNNRDYVELYSEEFSSILPRYTLIPDESVFRRKIKRNRVLLDDKFEKQNRNIDYARLDDEPFSDDHLFYKDDGFIGFSDYSIVGDNFFESGFAPYAVALHIVYFSEDKSLRVKHFVSDSNEDITNPAGKFYEALEKLNDWDMAHEMDTLGLKGLLIHFKNETYPGLGTVKKLSMMHHIELVGQYLDGVE